MKRPPFKILPSVAGSYRRDGKWVCGGRLSFCWENLVQAIASGVGTTHEIRRKDGPWYRIEMTVNEAEQALNPNHDFFGARRVARARRFRDRSRRQVTYRDEDSIVNALEAKALEQGRCLNDEIGLAVRAWLGREDIMAHTVDETVDEFGVDRFFVADENGDWIGDPHDTLESAQAEAARLDEDDVPA